MRAGSRMAVGLIGVLVVAGTVGGAPSGASGGSGWLRLSSRHGDLPMAVPGRQQTASLVGDFDGDGVADIVIAERTAAPSVVWLRRTAAGWTRYTMETEPLPIEAGGVVWDVDGDGDLDIVLGGDSASSQVWWWENPSPRFDPAIPWTRRLIKAGGGPKHHDHVVGDFDGDGKAELVFWNQGSRTLFLTRPPVDPRQSEPWPLEPIFTYTGREMEGLAAGDVNGDGKTDIVGGGRWFEHVTGNTFREHVIDDTQRFSRAAVGQLVDGGWAEVVFVAGDGIGRLKWYEHRSGAWSGHDVVGHDVIHGHTLQVADVDGDGHLDIFCAEMGQWTHHLPHPDNPYARTWAFFGDGKGSFEPRLLSRGPGVHEGRLADLDGDGNLDILAKPYYADTPRVDVLLNRGAPRMPLPRRRLDLWKRHVIDAARPWRAIFIDTVDLDGDGLRDVVSGGWWYRNPGSASGAWRRIPFGEPFRNFAALVDVDGDGRVDVLGTQGAGSVADPRFVLARNVGGGAFRLIHDVPPGLGDFLQGATAIAAGRGPVSIALSWHQAGRGIQLLTAPHSRSGRWTWTRIHRESQDEALSVGDIDRDGDQDLLLGTWWLRNDRGSWTKHVLHPTPGSPDRNRLADIDNDGRLDAVVGFEAINTPGKLAWYAQPADPTATWTEHVIAHVVGPMSLDVADMDGDGDLDVVVGEHDYARPDRATLWIFENVDGTGTAWRQHRVHTGDEHHDGARVVDIDNDGDLDIVSIGWSHGRVIIYENKAVDRTGAR